MAIRQGIFTLLHFDDADAKDSGPYNRIVTLAGDVQYDDLNDAFNPPPAVGEEPVSGSALWENVNPSTFTALQVFPTVKSDLILENDDLVLEGWFRFATATERDYSLFSYGGNNRLPAWELLLCAPASASNEFFAVQDQWSLLFRWVDRFLVERRISFPIPNAGQAIDFPFVPSQFTRFTFQFDSTRAQFQAWIGGNRVANKPGQESTATGNAVWDGLYCKDVTAESAVNLAIGGPHWSGVTAAYQYPFEGSIDEVRVAAGIVLYGDVATLPAQDTPFPDPDPLPEPEPPEQISISRCMLSGMQKTYIEETRHTPALGMVSSKPPDREYPDNATHAGKLYLYQPNPDSSKIFLYVLININGPNQDENLVWLPFSDIKFGRTSNQTGTTWKSRRGNRLGEPF